MAEGKDSIAWERERSRLSRQVAELHPEVAREARKLIAEIGHARGSVAFRRRRIGEIENDINEVHRMTPGKAVREYFGYTPWGGGPMESRMRMREQLKKTSALREEEKGLREAEERVGTLRAKLGDLIRDNPPPRRHIEEPEAAADPERQTVTVRRGDTLWDLARIHLGDPHCWQDIYELPENRAIIGNDPNLILPGQSLIIPDTADGAGAAGDESYPPDRLWGGDAPAEPLAEPTSDLPPDVILPDDRTEGTPSLQEALAAEEPALVDGVVRDMNDRYGDYDETREPENMLPPTTIRPAGEFLPSDMTSPPGAAAPLLGWRQRGGLANMDPVVRNAFERAFQDQRDAGKFGFDDLLRRAEGWADSIRRAPNLNDVDQLQDLGDALDEPPEPPEAPEEDFVDVPADWIRR